MPPSFASYIVAGYNTPETKREKRLFLGIFKNVVMLK